MAPIPPSPNCPRPAPAAGLPRPAALPYLTVANARDAIAWYVDALGAVVVGEPFVMADGRIGHAELALSGGVLYLADEYPEIGLRGPAPQANSVSLMLEVPDTDAALERARERGAQVQREPYEDHGSRGAAIIDPFGHRWMLSGPMTGAAVPIQHGDVGYVSVWTPGRRPGGGVLRPRPRLGVRPGHPSGHQHQAAHRASTACRARTRCSAATR